MPEPGGPLPTMTAPRPLPPTLDARHARRLGTLLVLAQFGLMALLVVLGAQALLPWPAWPWLLLAGVLAAAGALLGMAALRANRPGNFNIHPEPRAGGQLVARGPYRWIRHPMYAAVLLLTGAAATVAASGPAALAWAALLAVLVAKAGLEERWLAAHHAAYADYCRRTRRLLPGLY